MSTIGKRFAFWLFMLTGKVLPGFDPETDGLEGIKKLVRGRFPEVRQLRTEELGAWLADPKRPRPEILDVRKPAEFFVSHVSGARRIDPDVKGLDMKSLAASNHPVVLYCAVGYRSSALARRLMMAGLTNVFSLEGSIFQWVNDGRPLVDSNGPATKVHPYGHRWRVLLKPQVRGSID